MLRVRVIPALLLKNGRMVKRIRFGAGGERDVGFPLTTAKIYDSQDADELIFLDINATSQGRSLFLDTLREVAQYCFVPITAGGGIRTLKDISEVLGTGADKVCINTAAVENPKFITQAAQRFGAQCIVVALDAKLVSPGKYEVYTRNGTKSTGKDVGAFAEYSTSLGAGELLITSIDREGTMKGYDLALVRVVTKKVSVPVIANGGAGTRQHFLDAVHAGAHAVAASSVFHFSDSNIPQVKTFLFNAGIPVRIYAV